MCHRRGQERACALLVELEARSVTLGLGVGELARFSTGGIRLVVRRHPLNGGFLGTCANGPRLALGLPEEPLAYQGR
jgi:hypothetical protein